MRKFVVISDLHAHPFAAFAKGDGAQNSRLRRTLGVLDRSLARAREEGVPWLFAGDLVHTAGYALNAVLSGLTEVLSWYPDVQKVAVWGNHDARGVGGLITLEQTVYPALIRAVPNLRVLNDSSAEVEGTWIYGLGYQPNTTLVPNLIDPSGFVRGEIGLFHQTVRGSHAPSGFTFSEGIDPEVLARLCSLAIVGHVHHAQGLENGVCSILVPGSPEHHNFGDEGEHGWWVLSLPDEKGQDPEVEFVPGGSPEFRTVDKPSQVQADGHFYRVRSVEAGESLPENASAIAPGADYVAERDALKGASTVEQVVQAWVAQTPPPEGVSRTEAVDDGLRLISAREPVHLRPARVRRISLSNFGSYAQADLVVQDGIWLVTGQGRDFNSNGAGKTTLVGEALYWALFGRNTKGLAADEVIRRGTDTASVSVVLEDEDRSVVVTRTKSHGKSTLEVNEAGVLWAATSVDEMTAKLSSWLGVTPEIHQALGYFSQEKLMLFSSATDAERKSLLADLIGLSAYADAAAAAGSQESSFESSKTYLEGQVSAQEEVTAHLESELAQAEADAGLWADGHGREVGEARSAILDHAAATKRWREAVDAKLSRLQVRVTSRVEEITALGHAHDEQLADEIEAERIEPLKRQLESAKLQRDAVRRLISSEDGSAIERAIAALDERAEQLSEEDRRAQQAATEVLRRQSKAEGTIQSAAAAVEGCLVALRETKERLSTGICPSCLQPIDSTHKEHLLGAAERQVTEAQTRVMAERERGQEIADEYARAEELVERTSGAVEQAAATRKTLEGMLRNVRAWEKADAWVTVLETKLGEQRALAENEAALQAEREIARRTERLLRRLRGAANRVSTAEAAAAQHQAGLEAELRRLEGTENPHASAVTRLTEAAGTARQEAEARRASVTEAALMVARSAYWKQGFGKQGIQSLLMEEVAALFNRARGDIFPVLTQGVYDVQFSTLSKLRNGDTRERTAFLIWEHGVPVPYGALSGGQRRRVDVGVMLTLAVAVSEWMRVPGLLGVLTLDEVFGFLDESGGEGLLDALRVVQERIPTIFCVTHDARLQSLFPAALRVVQDADGISTLV